MLTVHERHSQPHAAHPGVFSERSASIEDHPEVLAEVYSEPVNFAVWRRSLSPELRAHVASLAKTAHGLNASMTVSPEAAAGALGAALGLDPQSPLCEDVAYLADIFCCLFERERLGLRLALLDKAMCPRFHVDNVACRLLTTYCGPATHWLPNPAVDRSRLGAGNKGLPDSLSGLYRDESDVRQLEVGDVALLKGEGWHGNEGRGLVHRSPAVQDGERRLVLTLDIV